MQEISFKTANVYLNYMLKSVELLEISYKTANISLRSIKKCVKLQEVVLKMQKCHYTANMGASKMFSEIQPPLPRLPP
jgi:hypothetical protein